MAVILIREQAIPVYAAETTHSESNSTTKTTLSTDTLFSVLTTDSKVLEQGKTLVRGKACWICHVIEGKGGKKSDMLDGISQKLTPDKIKLAITDPKKINTKSDMKTYTFSDDELNAVIAYLLSLPAPEKKDDKK